MNQTVNMFPIAPDQLEDENAALAAVAQESANVGMAFMKFTKGDFLYGVENTVVTLEDRWFVNPSSFARGYIGWLNGECAGEVMKPLSQAADLPAQADLQPPIEKTGSNGWGPQWAIQLKKVADEDHADEVLFKTPTQGGIQRLQELAGAIAAGRGRDPRRVIPVVQLDADSYMHPNKAYGEIFKPIFKITGWADADGVEIAEKPSLV